MNQQQAKERIEQALETKLVSTYSSREDENPDETHGHYEVYEAEPNPLEAIADRVEPALIKVYDSGDVQLFHDATPYPLKAHSPRQRREMSMALNESPIGHQHLTKEDWQGLINQLLSEYGD